MSEIRQLNKSILGLTGSIDLFMKSLGNMETKVPAITKKVNEVTKAQHALGLSYRENAKKEDELFSKKTGLRVNRFGDALGEAGKKMTTFNKRTTIVSESIKQLNKTNDKFNLGFKSFSTYTKMGGNAFEYLAEFISSGREEITVFGIEVAKARKFLYGFMPAGTFRTLNKFSSMLQLAGSQYRRFFTDGKAARAEVELLKEAIKVAEEGEELDGLIERLAELEVPDSIFVKAFRGFQKLTKTVSKPLVTRIDVDMKDARKILKKNSFSNIFFTKGQLKHRARHELKQLKSPFKKIKKSFAKNFLLNLTPTKKLQVKQLKEAVKTARKFDITNVSQGALKQKQKELGALEGVKDDNVVALQSSFSSLGEEVIKAEQKLKKIEKSIAGGNPAAGFKKVDAQRKLNELLTEETKVQKELQGAKDDYARDLEAVIKFADVGGIMQQENAQLIMKSEKEINSIRTKGLQGYRKKLVNLGDSYKKHNAEFDVGTVKYDKAISRTQKIIDSIDVKKIEEEMERIGETAEKAAKREIELKEKIANYKPNINTNKIDTTAKQLELMKTELAALEKVKGREEELNQLLVKRENAVKKIEGFKLKSKGQLALKDEIKLQKDNIKLGKKALADAEKTISASNKRIKQSEKAKKKIQKDFNSQIASAENMAEKLKLTKDMQKEIAKEDVNIDAATKDKNEAVKNQEAAIVEIDKDQLKLEGLEEQLDVLKEMREAALDKMLQKHPFFKGINKLRKGFKQILPMLGQALKVFMMGFIYVSIAILGILALVKIFGPIIKDTIGTIIKVLAPIIGFTMGAIGLIFDGVKQVFGAFFGDGTMTDAIDGLLKIGLGILGTLLGLALAALAAVGTLLMAGIGHAIKRVGLFFKEMFSSWKGFLKNFKVILAIVGIIAALFFGWPVALAVVVGAIILKVITMAIDPILSIIRAIKNGIEKLNPKKRVKKFFGGIRDKVTGRATGGIVGIGETTLVGENGPELIKLPAGSKVYTNTRTKQMTRSNSLNNNNTINITINAKDTSDAEMRRIAEKVGRLVNNSINRNTGMSGIR
jgi:hypothetical protein|tara:strand:- start:2957 stop:6112 length:3156 start_codon:yes stop_codon:yes gene_type:complete